MTSLRTKPDTGTAYALTARDLAAALMGKPLVDPKPAPTVEDLIAFVKAHPSNPYPNIGWGLLSVGATDGDDLAQTRRRLLRQLPVWKAQVTRGHWAGEPHKVHTACLILDLMDEFFGEEV